MWSSLFWVVARRGLVVIHRCFGTHFRSLLHGSMVKGQYLMTSAEMVVETLVYSPFKNLTQLLARETCIEEWDRRTCSTNEKHKTYILYIGRETWVTVTDLHTHTHTHTYIYIYIYIYIHTYLYIHIWKNNIKTDLLGTECEVADWIQLAQERKWDGDNDYVATDDDDYDDDYEGDNNNLIQFLFINVSSLQPKGPLEKQCNI